MKSNGMKASRCRVGRPRVREKDLQKLITDWLTLAGIRHIVTDAALVVVGDQARRSKVEKSWPDLTLLMPYTGRFGAIEVKTPTGEFQPGQEHRIEELRAEGAWVIVPRSLDEVVASFEAEYRDLGVWKLPSLFALRRAVKAYEQGVGAR